MQEAVNQGRLVLVFAEPSVFGYLLPAVWRHAHSIPRKIRALSGLPIGCLRPPPDPN
ncbi:hypothetical protein D3C87_960280 [compost metagenome]